MSDSEHLSGKGKKQANLWYGNNDKYRDNAYKEISNNKDRRERYDDLVLLMRTLSVHPNLDVLDKGEESHAKRYCFKFEDNFDKGSTPWKNQAHHLLPQEFWKNLTAPQKELLKEIKYNIDNGLNLIYLPEVYEGHLVHELPIHYGSHDSYSDAVLGDATSVSNDLQKAENDGGFCENNNPPKAILQRLEELQDKYWKILANKKIKIQHVNDVSKGKKAL